MPAQSTLRSPAEATPAGHDESSGKGDSSRQARLGNAFLVDQLRAKGQIPSPPTDAGEMIVDEPVGCLALKAFTQSESLGVDDVRAGSVGHTWVAFQAYGDANDRASWGFWPSRGFSTDPTKDVPGEVKSPDPDEGNQRYVRRYPVTIDQLNDMYTFIEANWRAPYNLYTFNCTDFATGAVERAGQSPPDSGVLGVDYPNALADGIRAENQAEGRNDKGVAQDE